MRYVALTPAQMTTNLQIHLRAAGTEDMNRCTVRSPGWEGRRAIRWTVRLWAFYGVRGVTVHNRRTHRDIGLTASSAVAEVKRSRQTAFIEADVLQLTAKLARSYTACARDYRSRIY